MEAKQDDNQYDRSAEDVGNVQLLEHVNLTVPDQGIAALFYVTGIGFTRDPYIDFGTFNMWVNGGEQQFHLPKAAAQVLRGHIGVIVPSHADLKKRLQFISKPMQGTQFAWQEENNYLKLTCPWGNEIRVYEPTAQMPLGIPYVDLDVPPGSCEGIARFYQQVLDCPIELAVNDNRQQVHIKMGCNQELIYSETEQPIPEYDGHHIAIYVANFSKPHQLLNEHGLITEESDQYQYRFQAVIDPDTGETLTEIEHEVRSLSHAMYRRPLVNRNPATNFFTYKKGNEIFVPQ